MQPNLLLLGLTTEFDRVSTRLQSGERENKTLRGEAQLRVRFVSRILRHQRAVVATPAME